MREGKKTTIVYYAMKSVSQAQREFLLSVLGDRDASDTDVREATGLLVSLGAVRKTADLALNHVNRALPELDLLPDSEDKHLLASWAHHMIDREF